MSKGRAHLWKNALLVISRPRSRPSQYSRFRRPALSSGQLSTIRRLPQSALYDHREERPISDIQDEDMPPDYELQSYWETRFAEERHFEWLGDGRDTILPRIRAFLDSPSTTGAGPARLLHIGAGTSSLSERLRELYTSVYGENVDEGAIVNADFVEELVARKRAAEDARRAVGGPTKGMRWVRADALQWLELNRLAETVGGSFDLVVEKSTSDAISCGEDISYTEPSTSHHPVIDQHLKTHAGRTVTLSPVEVLAIHLASLVRPGGLWVALTFSANRFPFLSSPETVGGSSPHAAIYWSLEQVVTVDAPTGAQQNVHAPTVQHYICLIRRNSTPC